MSPEHLAKLRIHLAKVHADKKERSAAKFFAKLSMTSPMELEAAPTLNISEPKRK